MNPPKLFTFAMTGLGLAVALTGCAPAGTDGGSGGSSSGSGGSSTGSGGSGSGGSISSSGGATGSGGVSSGGSTGSGGASSGGSTGSGGASSGGSTGSGGASSGGSTGSGGAAGRGGGSVGGSTGSGGRSGGGGGSGSGGTAGSTFTLTSPDHLDGAKFGPMYTCAAMNGTFGAGVNPELNWSGVPAGTMSFAMTFIDTTIGETMAMGQHWAIWNIPATVAQFPKGTKTLTGTLMNARQNGAFLTPCAQSLKNNMDDEYEFTIYALSAATLSVSGTSVANALTALKAVTPLGTAKLRGHAGLKGM